MILVPGKLYKVTSSKGLPAMLESNLGANHVSANVKVLKKGQLFLFIETITYKQTERFSKILVDESVLITYNGYLLENSISELEQYERLSNPSSKTQD